MIGWTLWGIGSHPQLSMAWAFKGGTCLKKCFIETYRFSEDLDFTVLPEGPANPDQLLPILQQVFESIYAESGIDFRQRDPVLRVRPNGESVEGRIYYQGPRGAPGYASIKLDLTTAEEVVRPTVLRPIGHQYPDSLPPPATVRCYGFEEVFAEKLRAMGERCRPRDLYDIVTLFRRRDFRPFADLVQAVYVEKCKSKGIRVFRIDDLQSSPFLEELKSEWVNMLAHQLPAMPPFADFWNELPRLFKWLSGESEPDHLSPIAVSNDTDEDWSPPPTSYVWGQGIPLEPVRFAAANHLCVDLHYQGTVRRIEPYSLRKTRAGNLLLYAVRSASGQIRAYRVDRISGVEVTSVPFRPRFVVEFTDSGELTGPQVRRTGRRLGISPRARRRSSRPRHVYILECPSCGKRFRRLKYSLNLRPHKEPRGDYRCYARSGFLVERRYE
ncbi:MAG: nucleotidyl transferase AbiEii/AbiGii toxin family protein [Chloroflexi bacterium]|nr:nucleotidyl transferase AbiEii/AbiGii toxin family protein [Chloroflexota bacterium]